MQLHKNEVLAFFRSTNATRQQIYKTICIKRFLQLLFPTEINLSNLWYEPNLLSFKDFEIQTNSRDVRDVLKKTE